MNTQPDRKSLSQTWEQVFACPCPKHLPKSLLTLMLGWQAQMQTSLAWQGKSGRARFRKMLLGNCRAELRPGMRLVREWQGEVYHVLVLPQGFEMDGRIFKSLSAIARHITGTPWSGPLFFGVD